MTPYLVTGLFAYFAAILSVLKRNLSLSEKFGLTIFGFLMICFIGFRFEVGKDWNQYYFILRSIRNLPTYDALFFTDPGYSLINIISGWLDLEISFVFVVCALVLVAGIVKLALRTPFAWIAVAAAMPHIVTVMSMDHVRQATALGCILIGMGYLAREKAVPFLVWAIIAILFHRTSIIVLALGVVSISRNRFVIVPLVLVSLIVMAQSVYSERLEVYAERYLEGDMQSRGALFRLGLASLPAIGYLFLRRRFQIYAPFDRVLTFMSLGAIAALVILPLSPSAVVIDRIAKYFLPVHLVFWPYFVSLFKNVSDRLIVTTAVVAFFFVTHAYWLAQSELAELYWLPYKSVLWS